MQKLSIALSWSLCLAAVGCGDDDEPAQPRATEGSREATSDTPALSRQGGAAGMRWEAPEPFRPVEPGSSMRAAEYVFPGEAGADPASLTVFFFGPGQGGSIEDNIQRWVGQFEQSDGRPSMEAAQITEREANGLRVHLVDVGGTYSAMTPMGAPGQPQPAQRMLAAIVEAPQGSVFFKMVGSTSVMERAQAPFEQLVESFHPAE